MQPPAEGLIDGHAHVAPRAFFEELKRSGGSFGVSVEETPAGYALTLPNLPPLRPASGGLIDLETRRDWLQAEGVERQIVAVWLDIHGYSLPADKATTWARLVNEHVVRSATDAGDAFRPLATVPLSDGESAAKELEYAVRSLGALGAMLPSDPVDIDLADTRFEPLWAAAAELGAPLLLHGASHSKWSRVGPSYLGFSLGRTFDTTVLAAKLILGGLLDRHPRLKLMLCHGGGFLPYQIGRIAFGYERRTDRVVDLERGGPEAYLPLLYYDTLTLNPRSLRLLLDLAGSDHVMVGSDYVWEPAGGPLLAAVRELELTPHSYENLCRGTARGFFGD